MIWRKTLECRSRILNVHIEHGPPDKNNYSVVTDTRQQHSKFLRVNRESREAASEFYRARIPCKFIKHKIDAPRSEEQEGIPGYLAFNPAHDFLHITDTSNNPAEFLYDLKTTFDPLHVGMRNLVADQRVLVSLLYLLGVPNHIDAKVRESVRDIFSQLHEVFFIMVTAFGRMSHRWIHHFLRPEIFNRSQPIMPRTGPFERLPRDPRDISPDLKDRIVMGGDGKNELHNWNQLLDKLEISPKDISYRYLVSTKPDTHTRTPTAKYYTIHGRESADLFLEKEQELWLDGEEEQARREPGKFPPDPLNDGLERPVETALGFWLFPLEAVSEFAHIVDQREGTDLTKYWPELGLLNY